MALCRRTRHVLVSSRILSGFIQWHLYVSFDRSQEQARISDDRLRVYFDGGSYHVWKLVEVQQVLDTFVPLPVPPRCRIHLAPIKTRTEKENEVELGFSVV
jgi:hypothetical protein